MCNCFPKRWNVIFFALPFSVAISNKRVIKQFLISHTVLPLHLTSFDSASLTLSCPLTPLLSLPHCGNALQVWCTDCARVRFKYTPNSNQIVLSHYLLLHFSEYRVAAKFSQQIYIIRGKAVWDEKEIQLGGPPVTRDPSWSPLTPITAGKVWGECCHADHLNEIPSCGGYFLSVSWSAKEVNGCCVPYSWWGNPQGKWPSPL